MILCNTKMRWYLKGEWDLGRFISDGRCNSMSCANEKDLEEGRWTLPRGKGRIAGALPLSLHGGWVPGPKPRVVKGAYAVLPQ